MRLPRLLSCLSWHSAGTLSPSLPGGAEIKVSLFMDQSQAPRPIPLRVGLALGDPPRPWEGPLAGLWVAGWSVWPERSFGRYVALWEGPRWRCSPRVKAMMSPTLAGTSRGLQHPQRGRPCNPAEASELSPLGCPGAQRRASSRSPPSSEVADENVGTTLIAFRCD